MSPSRPISSDAAPGSGRTRREFVRDVALGAAAVAVLPALEACASAPSLAPSDLPSGASLAETLGDAIVLPPLPFAPDALAPVISAETLEFHHGKHHAAYARNLAKMTAGLPAGALPATTLEGLISAAHAAPDRAALYNNAAQLWNHTFYWEGLTPGGGAPSGALAAAIERDFGDLQGLVAALRAAALGQFGSGWAWLSMAADKLVVSAMPDADSPLITDLRPLLTVDVWEHAYYIDYHNDRAAHVDAVLARLVNWDVVGRRLAA